MDILVNNNPLNLQTSVFCNKTFMGLLANYFSFTSFSYKIGLIRTLVDRVYKMNNSWLGFLILILRKNLFPVHIVEKVINRYLSRATIHPSASSQVQQTVSTYYFKVAYVCSFTRETQKRPRKLVQRYCTNIEIKIALSSLRLVTCLVLTILFLSISVHALSTSFHAQDVMPVTSARLADISRRAFVGI